MPPTTERISNAGMIRRWRGVVTAADQLGSIEDFADPAFTRGLRYLIVDYTSVTSLDMTTAEIRQAAERAKVLQPQLRVAIIAPTDVLFGMARMFETTTELLAGGRHYVTHVIRSLDEAIEWLQHELPDTDLSQARSRLLE